MKVVKLGFLEVNFLQVLDLFVWYAAMKTPPHRQRINATKPGGLFTQNPQPDPSHLTVCRSQTGFSDIKSSQ